MAYKLLVEYKAEDLNELVAEFVDKGWELSGGAFATPHGAFGQAVVKKEPDVKKPLPTKSAGARAPSKKKVAKKKAVRKE